MNNGPEHYSMEVPMELGAYVPNDVHAVSVCLPTWENTLGWARKDPIVIGKMETGYPRFFIHALVDELAEKIIAMKKDLQGKDAKGLVFPLLGIARGCREWVCKKIKEDKELSGLASQMEIISVSGAGSGPEGATAAWGVHVVSAPPKLYMTLRSYWQHVGDGISSRQAQYFLAALDNGNLSICPSSDFESGGPFASNLLYSAELKEKKIIREMVADSFSKDGAAVVGKRDVFLFPSGMKAIYEVWRVLLDLKEAINAEAVVAYGFNYVDTYKIIDCFSPSHISAHMLGYGNAADMTLLESWLRAGKKILAVFCEFTSNPLLKSPDLARIRELSREYGFLVVCDDTVGTAINLEVLPLVDLVVTSLTKLFSGGCNVMGGTITISPFSSRHDELHSSLSNSFVDIYFPLDARVMESNGRDFRRRVEQTSSNALVIAELLESHPSVEKVYYPALSDTKALYDRCKRPEGGYGYLISLIFKRDADAIKFLDNLHTAKGPSLGTDFTLVCPYTLFAHFKELEWAAEYGVAMHLVRISVGRENIDELKKVFAFALAKTGVKTEATNLSSEQA